MTFDTSGMTERIHNNGGTKYFEDTDGEIVAKACTKCGEIKRLCGFRIDKGCLAGRKPSCRECAAEHYRNNRDKEIERNVRYRINNRDKIAEYRRKNRDRMSEYQAEYYRNNRDKLAERHAEYYRNNRDRVLEKGREYRRNNRDKIAEYLNDNRNRIAEYQKEYRLNKPHIQRLVNSRRRARLRNLPDNLTQEQKVKILEHFGGACALSGDKGDGQLDHVIPISVGHGGTIYENMIPLRADLNMSKRASNIFDWFADNRERFGLSQRKFDELIEYLADINEMTVEEYRDYVYWCHDNPRTVDEIKQEETTEEEAS